MHKVVRLNAMAAEDSPTFTVALQDITENHQLQQNMSTMTVQMMNLVKLISGTQSGNASRSGGQMLSHMDDSTLVQNNASLQGVLGLTATSHVSMMNPKTNTPQEASTLEAGFDHFQMAPLPTTTSLDLALPLPKRKKKAACVRKPYRFCVPCWIQTGEFCIKVVNSPSGDVVMLGGHTQLTCPNWLDKVEPTPEQHRGYGAAFKRAARQGDMLQTIAFDVFKQNFPHLTDAELNAHIQRKAPASDVKSDMQPVEEGLYLGNGVVTGPLDVHQRHAVIPASKHEILGASDNASQSVSQ